jgi:hypothetical protein
MLNMTLKRLQWLRLLDVKPSNPRKTRTGYDCMAAGLTEWNYVNAKGEHMTAAEAKERYGDRYWDHVRIEGERLTKLGHEVLLRHRHMHTD